MLEHFSNKTFTLSIELYVDMKYDILNNSLLGETLLDHCFDIGLRVFSFPRNRKSFADSMKFKVFAMHSQIPMEDARPKVCLWLIGLGSH